MHGISGASGKKCYNPVNKMTTVSIGHNPCLWCEVIRDGLQIAPHDRECTTPLRSLQSLECHHTRFLTLGAGDLRKAKQYYNVIGK